MDGHSRTRAQAAHSARLGGRRHARSTAPGEPVPAEASHLSPGLLSAPLPSTSGLCPCGTFSLTHGPGYLQPASCNLQVAARTPPPRSLPNSLNSHKAPAPDSPVPMRAPSEHPPPRGKQSLGCEQGVTSLQSTAHPPPREPQVFSKPWVRERQSSSRRPALRPPAPLSVPDGTCWTPRTHIPILLPAFSFP